MKNKKLKKSLDYANKEKIPYVIILGENEIKNNTIIIKDMFNNNNIELKLNDLGKIKDYILNNKMGLLIKSDRKVTEK